METKTQKELEGQEINQVGNYTMQVRVNRLGEQMLEDEFIHCIFNGNKMTINSSTNSNVRSGSMIIYDNNTIEQINNSINIVDYAK